MNCLGCCICYFLNCNPSFYDGCYLRQETVKIPGGLFMIFFGLHTFRITSCLTSQCLLCSWQQVWHVTGPMLAESGEFSTSIHILRADCASNRYSFTCQSFSHFSALFASFCIVKIATISTLLTHLCQHFLYFHLSLFPFLISKAQRPEELPCLDQRGRPHPRHLHGERRQHQARLQALLRGTEQSGRTD